MEARQPENLHRQRLDTLRRLESLIGYDLLDIATVWKKGLRKPNLAKTHQDFSVAYNRYHGNAVGYLSILADTHGEFDAQYSALQNQIFWWASSRATEISQVIMPSRWAVGRNARVLNHITFHYKEDDVAIDFENAFHHYPELEDKGRLVAAAAMTLSEQYATEICHFEANLYNRFPEILPADISELPTEDFS